MKVIGIDPGINATGYGILENSNCICIGTIRPKSRNHNKIADICRELDELVTHHQPDYAALEKVFYHKNIKSLIRSSELRGAIILTLLNRNMPIVEYSPSQIKLTTTGNGRASKQQVRYFMEKLLINPLKKKVSNHASDAISIAYTAIQKLEQAL